MIRYLFHPTLRNLAGTQLEASSLLTTTLQEKQPSVSPSINLVTYNSDLPANVYNCGTSVMGVSNTFCLDLNPSP